MKNKFNTYILLLIFLSLFSTFIFRAYSLQVVEGVNYDFYSSNLATGSFIETQPRGLILDANSNILAKNNEKYEVILNNIAKISNIDQLLKSFPYKPIGENVYKIYNLDNKSLNELRSVFKEYKDIKINTNLVRDYLYPEEFSHILGYTGLVSNDQINENYGLNDYIGKYKLEHQLEENLRGIPNKRIFIDGVEYNKPGEPGQNVYLTIDKDWQLSLYRIIGKYSDMYNAAGGAGVIIDDSNGDVVAMSSYPGFDTNLFINGLSQDAYEELLKDRRKPLLDKAIGNAFAPGSTFKIISSYNLLESGILNRDSHYYSNRCINLGANYNFCEFGKFFYGDMNIVRALYKSSNLFFCNYTLQDYQTYQFNNFQNAASLFNIGSKTGIDLEGEASGNMDSPEYKLKTVKDKWFDGDTCNAAIGQGAILTTPIQMAMVASAINNNGIYYRPHLIEKISDINGNIIQERKPEVVKNIPIKPETLNLIKEGLNGVVHNPDGTVYPFLNNVPGNVRAKTGTAEVYENVNGEMVYRTHGWIVGSFDYNNKSYSFAFHLSYGGGGFYIAQAARDFINCIYSNFSGCI